MASKTHGTRQKPMHRGPSGNRPLPPGGATSPRARGGKRSPPPPTAAKVASGTERPKPEEDETSGD